MVAAEEEKFKEILATLKNTIIELVLFKPEEHVPIDSITLAW